MVGESQPHQPLGGRDRQREGRRRREKGQSGKGTERNRGNEEGVFRDGRQEHRQRGLVQSGARGRGHGPRGFQRDGREAVRRYAGAARRNAQSFYSAAAKPRVLSKSFAKSPLAPPSTRLRADFSNLLGASNSERNPHYPYAI